MLVRFDRTQLTKTQIADRVEYVLRFGTGMGEGWILMVLDGRQMDDDSLKENLTRLRNEDLTR